MQMQDLRNRNLTFEKRIKELEDENGRYAAERDRLQNDPEYFEKIARERLGLIKDGEVIYKVLPPGVKKSEPVEEAKPQAKKTVVKPAAKTTAKMAVKPAPKTAAKTSSKTTTSKTAASKTSATVNATSTKTTVKN